MSTTSQTVNLSDYYYSFLKRLSRESKIDLIVKLAQSLNDEAPAGADDTITLEDFFEAFQSDTTAEEILREIQAVKKARLLHRGPNEAGTF